PNRPSRMHHAPHRWATERKQRFASHSSLCEPFVLSRVETNSKRRIALFQEATLGLFLANIDNVFNSSPTAVAAHQGSSRPVSDAPASCAIHARESYGSVWPAP